LAGDLLVNKHLILKRLLDSVLHLGKFLQDTQQKKNEEEYNIGLAEVLNGTAELPGQMFDTYQKETDILRRSADADTQTANSLEQNGQLASCYRVPFQ